MIWCISPHHEFDVIAPADGRVCHLCKADAERQLRRRHVGPGELAYQLIDYRYEGTYEEAVQIRAVLMATLERAKHPERLCDFCKKPYRGPAVYCSNDCAFADRDITRLRGLLQHA